MNHDDNKAGGLEHAMNKVGDVVGGGGSPVRPKPR